MWFILIDLCVIYSHTQVISRCLTNVTKSLIFSPDMSKYV